MKLIQQQFCIEQTQQGKRLDQAIHDRLPEFSRSKIQTWIEQGFILLNDQQAKSKQKVYLGDRLDLDIDATPQIADQPEDIEIDILHQDDSVFVVNKPAGLVVHPAAGHQSGTLLNALLFRDPSLQQLPRAGIVHRLDKDTTGVMVVARNLQAHNFLVDQLQQRLVKREYLAIAQGVITAGRTIEGAIGRHPVDRKKMALRTDGKPATTHFQVAQKFRFHCLIDVQLETGRTHQIRVHLASIRHALIGDKTYAGRLQLPAGISDQLGQQIRAFPRQALHARRLSFEHPETHLPISIEAPVPDDMSTLIDSLNSDAECTT